MRTIKASEVVKGMRVRVEESLGSRTTQVTEGPVLCVDLAYSQEVGLALDGTTFGLDPDHPVTVLAEPEPEWVEGAWYWVEINGNKTHAKRVEGGWVRWDGAAYPTWEDIDRSRVVAVLGRVLIVDWPGDDVARVIESVFEPTYEPSAAEDNRALKALADAIRTQGGAR